MRLAAATGLTLVAPLLVAGPAQAGLVDGAPLVGSLVPPVPVIEAGGPGEVEFLGNVVCSSDGSARKVCDALPLGGLGGLPAVVLTAVPGVSGGIPQWGASCPEPVGAVCTIPVTELVSDTPLAPVVEFLPPLGGSAGEAPDTRITSKQPGDVSSHTFQFKAEPETEDTTFECTLKVTPKGSLPSGAPGSHDWRACKSGVAYSNLADGSYTFGVRAVEGEGAEAPRDQTPATQSWTKGAFSGVPETRITAGPKANAWVLGNRVTYRFSSTVAGSEFQCDYARRTYACDSGSFTVRGLTAGSHLFEVYAMANKTRDFTPAKRSFHVPLDDRALKPLRSWSSKKQRGHFANTYRETRVTGAALVTKGTQRFRRIALVADRGRGHGTVQVFWNKKLLKEVSLHAEREQRRKVIAIKRFTGTMRQGTVRVVVVSSGKVVRIDGLGIASR